jgi:hypothetical protein
MEVILGTVFVLAYRIHSNTESASRQARGFRLCSPDCDMVLISW